MKMKRFLSLAVCAALLAALCACGSVSQDKLESVMDKYVADGNPQRAAQLAETWLSQQKESDYSHAYLYEKLADLYENDLSAPDEALATLQKGYEATGSSDLLDRLIQTATGNSLNQLAGVFPTSDELVLEGRPFAQWTGEELQAWLPVTEDSYNGTDNDNGTEEWYRVEYFKNENVTISRDQLSGSSTLRVEFDNLGGWDNSYRQEGPEPTLPRGIAVGDDLAVVLEKLGVPETIVPYLADASSIYFDVTGSEVSVWCSQSEYSSWKYLSIDYNNRDYYGELTFEFRQNLKTGKNDLTCYCLQHRSVQE